MVQRNHLPPPDVLQAQDCARTERQAGLPVPEEVALRRQVLHDGHLAEGSEACNQPAEVLPEQEAEDCVPCLRWCPQPHSRQRENHPGLTDLGAEDRHEGAEGAGQEGVTCFLCHK
jgi:hypothetical protein